MSGEERRSRPAGGDSAAGRERVVLPVVGPKRPEEAEAGAEGPGAAGPPAGGRHAEAPWWRLLVTLGTAGALAGVLIVGVYALTRPRIEAYKARVLHHAIAEVLKAPYGYDTLYVVDGALAPAPPAGADVRGLQRVYLGYREDGQPVGFAVVATEPGFQDLIRLIFGYDAASHKLLGMKVLESRETPGLGDKILKDEHFIGEFAGAEHPIVGVKIGSGDRGDPHQVDMITGATISSRTVIRAINEELERLGPLLDAYTANGANRANGRR